MFVFNHSNPFKYFSISFPLHIFTKPNLIYIFLIFVSHKQTFIIPDLGLFIVFFFGEYNLSFFFANMANSNFFMESQGMNCHSPTQGHVLTTTCWKAKVAWKEKSNRPLVESI
jgi:hypothetical protein